MVRSLGGSRVLSRNALSLLVIVCGLVTAALASELRVSIRDASTGKPTAAAVRLYDSQGRLEIPDNALDLGSMGYLYATGALIHYADWTSPRVRSQDPYFGSSYFRAKHPPLTACFFVDGAFKMELAPGRCRLVVNKGLEYVAVDKEITIGPDRGHHEAVHLSRWVDMARRGWYSGDAHVHIERRTPESSRAALLWAAAEDVHVSNIMLMGDAEQTYYPQYAYGPGGRYQEGDRVLVAGQEDPRTEQLGHTLHLRIAGPVRDAARYYHYQPVFEGIRRQGGLSGLAHVGRRRWSFNVDRGLSLVAPTGQVDFVEIAQMGYIGVNLWYEFLNLGFRLTAMAGSDVPWGGTIGRPRVYAYTGSGASFDAERWFEAVRQGRTFVTTGPMLGLAVNGQPPGSLVRLKRGETVTVQAHAWGHPGGARPLVLEIVSLGKPLKTVRPTGPAQNQLETAMRMTAERSFWVTARCQTNEEPLMDQPGFFSGAIATPVYVEVDGQPWRDLEHIRELVARRLASLDRVEEWLATRESLPEMGAQLNSARSYYTRLLKQD